MFLYCSFFLTPSLIALCGDECNCVLLEPLTLSLMLKRSLNSFIAVAASCCPSCFATMLHMTLPSAKASIWPSYRRHLLLGIPPLMLMVLKLILFVHSVVCMCACRKIKEGGDATTLTVMARLTCLCTCMCFTIPILRVTGLSASLNDSSLTVRAELLATASPDNAPEYTLRMDELFVWHLRAPVRLLLLARKILHDMRCQLKTVAASNTVAASQPSKLNHMELVCSFLTLASTTPPAASRVASDPYVVLMGTSLLHELAQFCQLWWSMYAPCCVCTPCLFDLRSCVCHRFTYIVSVVIVFACQSQ